MKKEKTEKEKIEKKPLWKTKTENVELREEKFEEKNKGKLKKIWKTIIISILIIIILILGSFIYLASTNNIILEKINLNELAQNLGFNSKTYKFFNNIYKEDEYIMIMKGNIDFGYGNIKEVSITMAKKDEDSYFEMKTADENTVIFTKDKKAYMLIDKDKSYYVTEAEEREDDNLLFLTLDELKDMEKEKYTNGYQEIKGEKLYYEEYKESEENKVQYYFKNNKIIYIISTIEKESETVEIITAKNKVDNKIFEIPKEYIKKDLTDLTY